MKMTSDIFKGLNLVHLFLYYLRLGSFHIRKINLARFIIFLNLNVKVTNHMGKLLVSTYLYSKFDTIVCTFTCENGFCAHSYTCSMNSYSHLGTIVCACTFENGFVLIIMSFQSKTLVLVKVFTQALVIKGVYSSMYSPPDFSCVYGIVLVLQVLKWKHISPYRI